MLVLTAKIVIHLSFFLYFVIDEITEILDIEVFVTKQERLKREESKNQALKKESELRRFIASTAV